MIALLKQKQSPLTDLCRRYHVARLEVFGSAATGEFDPDTSDIDFLVEFHSTQAMNAADQYFGLLEDLQNLFGRRIDLVCAKAMRNRYFIQRVNQSRRTLYAA